MAKNAALLYFRMLLTMVVGLYTSRVVLQALGVEDFGIYNVVAGFVSLFGFLHGAMSSATQRFLSYEMGKKKDRNIRNIFSMSLNIHIIIALIVLLFGEIIGLWFISNHLNLPPERINAAKWVFHISLVSLMITIISVPYNALIIAHENMAIYAKVSILDVVFKLAIVFILTYMAFDKLKLYATLSLIVSFVVFIIYKVYCSLHYKESKFNFYWDKQLFKTLVSYTGWSLWGNIANVLSNQGVNILLNIFFGPVVNAARGVAMQASGALNKFVQNIQVAINPQIVKSYAADNIKYMHQLVNYGAKYNFFILIILSAPVLENTYKVLSIWLADVPPNADVFLKLIIINIIIDSVSAPLITSAQATGKIKFYQIVVGGILLLNVPLSYFILQLGFDSHTVFYVGILVSVTALAARLLMLKTLIQLSVVQFATQVILRGMVIVTFAYILSSVAKHLISSHNFWLESIVVTLSTLISICVFGFDNKEKKFIFNKLKSIREKA